MSTEYYSGITQQATMCHSADNDDEGKKHEERKRKEALSAVARAMTACSSKSFFLVLALQEHFIPPMFAIPERKARL